MDTSAPQYKFGDPSKAPSHGSNSYRPHGIDRCYQRLCLYIWLDWPADVIYNITEFAVHWIEPSYLKLRLQQPQGQAQSPSLTGTTQQASKSSKTNNNNSNE